MDDLNRKLINLKYSRYNDKESNPRPDLTLKKEEKTMRKSRILYQPDDNYDSGPPPELFIKENNEWRKISEIKPEVGRRILAFSPSYKGEFSLKYRLISGNFADLCDEITHWKYLEGPEL